MLFYFSSSSENQRMLLCVVRKPAASLKICTNACIKLLVACVLNFVFFFFLYVLDLNFSFSTKNIFQVDSFPLKNHFFLSSLLKIRILPKNVRKTLYLYLFTWTAKIHYVMFKNCMYISKNLKNFAGFAKFDFNIFSNLLKWTHSRATIFS